MLTCNHACHAQRVGADEDAVRVQRELDVRAAFAGLPKVAPHWTHRCAPLFLFCYWEKTERCGRCSAWVCSQQEPLFLQPSWAPSVRFS